MSSIPGLISFNMEFQGLCSVMAHSKSKIYIFKVFKWGQCYKIGPFLKGLDDRFLSEVAQITGGFLAI